MCKPQRITYNLNKVRKSLSKVLEGFAGVSRQNRQHSPDSHINTVKGAVILKTLPTDF